MNVSIENLLSQNKDKQNRLFINGTRISVNFIARFWRMGHGAEEIIEEYPHLPPAGVYAALAYYFSNRDKVDAEIDAEIEEEKQLKRQHLKFREERQREAA